MIWIAVTVIFLLALFFVFFVSRRFSPIPYFPSNKYDLRLVSKALHVQNNQIIYDLGAGDGSVIFYVATEAYKKCLDTSFIAIEINPILIVYMLFKRLIHPNRKNIKIMYGNIFSMNFKDFQLYRPSTKHVFYTYISPWYLKTVFNNITRQSSSFQLVSYFYPLPSALRKKPTRIFKGIHNIYQYE